MNALEVRGLCKAYPGFRLEDVSFSVPEGAVVGMVGRNGAGKSTTLKSLLGLVWPDAGEVRFFGRDLLREGPACRQQIGVALGEAGFYPKKKLKTLTAVAARFFPDWDDETYRRCCRDFGLDGEKTVDQLSAGMRVKYQLALAMSHGARLLILDEPTSGLDPVSRDELVGLFRTAVRGGACSILFSTHITSDLEKCADRIVVIRAGRVLCDDTLDGCLRRFAGLGSTLEEILISVERGDSRGSDAP